MSCRLPNEHESHARVKGSRRRATLDGSGHCRVKAGRRMFPCLAEQA